MKQNDLKITDDSQDRKYFTITPNFVLNHSTANDQALYAQMKKAAGENGRCFMTQQTMCKKLHIGGVKLRKALRYLLKQKWITFVGTTPGKTRPIDTYQINDIWKLNIDHYQEKKIKSKSNISSNKGKDKVQIRHKIKSRSDLEEDHSKEELINTVEAKASVIDKNVDNSGENRTPYPLPEGKRRPTAIGEVLKKHQIKTPDKEKRITHEFQAEALRYWKELGLKGTPTRPFFQHIKLAFKNGKQGRLAVALSYCKDAERIDDIEKLFYWRFANEPEKTN